VGKEPPAFEDISLLRIHFLSRESRCSIDSLPRTCEPRNGVLSVIALISIVEFESAIGRDANCFAYVELVAVAPM